MPTYMFLCSANSREFVTLNVTHPPLQLAVPFDGKNLTIRLFFFGSPNFTVEVTSDEEIQDLGQVADILGHVLAGIYDSVGLSEGMPCSVRIEGVSVVGSRTFASITLALPSFRDEIKTAGLELHDWITLCVKNPQLRAALRDVRLGMQTPGEAAVHCFRAVERIRQAFSTKSGDRSKTWGRLREALNVQRDWLDTYTANATAVRHGELVELPLDERNRCFAQAATVVIRYAAYLKLGQSNLPIATFPSLG